jgi:hypothetical protein
MLRYTGLCTFVIFLATSVSGICQGIPAWYRTPCPPPKPCVSSPPPTRFSRTVQVDVPAPCPPRFCGPAACYGNQFGPPSCRPPCPTRPVNVRVDVVVRPEVKKPCVPQRFCCENPPVFEPFFCRAAWMLRSAILAPLGLGEGILGHGFPRVPCPPPTPIACPPCQAPPCTGVVNACSRPGPQLMPRRQPLARCALPGPSFARHPSGSRAVQAHRGYRGAPFPR